MRIYVRETFTDDGTFQSFFAMLKIELIQKAVNKMQQKEKEQVKLWIKEVAYKK